jgi:hypothetical protein
MNTNTESDMDRHTDMNIRKHGHGYVQGHGKRHRQGFRIQIIGILDDGQLDGIFVFGKK